MKTKILILFLAVAPVMVQAQVNYAISGNTAYVTNSPSAAGNIVITNIYDGYPVTSIGDFAFSDCYSLRSVTIPDSVTSIGEGAFDLDNLLTSVAIGTNVTSIGANAFVSCYGLISVTIPNSVTFIGDEAFLDCPSLTSVTIGSGITFIGDEAFEDCYYLTNLTFLGNVPGSGYGLFDDVASDATVYYYYGTSGWSSTYYYLPTVMLGAPAPQVGSGSIGVQSGIFGFTLTGVTNQTATVEASTNLVNWQPVWTNMLSGASTNFTDAQWTNYPNRFYRISSP